MSKKTKPEVKYYENGNKEYELKVEDGLNVETVFDEDENKLEERRYKFEGDELVGDAYKTQFYPNGNKYSEFHWTEDRTEMTETYYFEDGTKRVEGLTQTINPNKAKSEITRVTTWSVEKDKDGKRKQHVSEGRVFVRFRDENGTPGFSFVENNY